MRHRGSVHAALVACLLAALAGSADAVKLPFKWARRVPKNCEATSVLLRQPQSRRASVLRLGPRHVPGGQRVSARRRVRRRHHLPRGSAADAHQRRADDLRRPGRVSLRQRGRVSQRADRHAGARALDAEPRPALRIRHHLPRRAQHGAVVLPVAHQHPHRTLPEEHGAAAQTRDGLRHHRDLAALARQQSLPARRSVQRGQQGRRLLHLPRRQAHRLDRRQRLRRPRPHRRAGLRPHGLRRHRRVRRRAAAAT